MSTLCRNRRPDRHRLARAQEQCGGRPRRAHYFPQVRGSLRCGRHWWLMLTLANERGAAKNREKSVWSRIEPLNFGAGTARFCRTRPNTVNQLHFSYIVECRQCQAPADCKLSAFESALGKHRRCWRTHVGMGKLHYKLADHSCVRRQAREPGPSRDQAVRTK